jgi:hypothetical protein
MKVCRVKRQRLSPEGFALSDLKTITQTQLNLGETYFIFSFHSPSVQAGLTPYVNTEQDAENFLQITADYINWFQQSRGGISCLVKEQYMEQMNNG